MAGEEGATAQDYINIHADPSISLDVKKNVSDNLSTQILNGTISFDDVKSMLIKAPGLMRDSDLMSAITTTFGTAIAFAGGLGQKAQAKAITWDLNRKLDAVGKQKDFHPGSHSMIIQDLQDKIERSQLPKDDPRHYSQTDYMKDYPGPRGDVDTGGGDNERGLVNIITPYAAHAIGGTTPVNSMAAQWYSTLGSTPSNPGAFNLTSQYAAAKAAVSQRLGNPTSVGQLAVNQSPFYNWLKDNSLNKGIL
jgi:hypothetical protein